ncbi:MAG: hypothetical protein IJN20_02675 [Oscillospiraceae bacterium]|nr:hypothetical protein [Oscillospiraceae bacterium]
MKYNASFHPPPTEVGKSNSYMRNQIRAQPIEKSAAPCIFSTSFCENRYQNLAALTERCCFFCKVFPQFPHKQGEIKNFSVLHNFFTAFAYSIRAPPSEV